MNKTGLCFSLTEITKFLPLQLKINTTMQLQNEQIFYFFTKLEKYSNLKELEIYFVKLNTCNINKKYLAITKLIEQNVNSDRPAAPIYRRRSRSI